MNFILTQMRLRVQHWLAVVGLLAAVVGGSAHAGNVGISVGIHVPGMPVYVMPPPPPPPVHYYRPAPPPPAVMYYPQPAPYGYWAPPPPPRGHAYGHGKHKPHRDHHHRRYDRR